MANERYKYTRYDDVVFSINEVTLKDLVDQHFSKNGKYNMLDVVKDVVSRGDRFRFDAGVVTLEDRHMEENKDRMTEALQIAAQCWCDEETKHIEMDSDLAKAVAKRLCVLMEPAEQSPSGFEYYRNQLLKCGT
jgi:hypothetical protein